MHINLEFVDCGENKVSYLKVINIFVFKPELHYLYLKKSNNTILRVGTII